MNQILLVPQPAEAGPGRTVSVRNCVTGSSFELDVNSAETGLEVAKRIAAKIGHRGLLVLTSGDCLIDQCQLLLPQVQHNQISYVVRKLGAGRVAMLWERLHEGKTLSDVDVAALNETMSLKFNQSLQGFQLFN